MFMSLKNVHCIHITCFATFHDYGVYPIAENFPFFRQLLEIIWKTAEKNFYTVLCRKYEGFFKLYRMKVDLV